MSGASTGSAVTSPTRHADDLFSTGASASKERYAGSPDIEEHPAMALVMEAEDAEKNNDMEEAALLYESAIKQLNGTITQMDNNKVKRKWREKVNDYEIQRLRINRKVRLRKKIAGGLRLRPSSSRSRHGRSQTMQPRARSKAARALPTTRRT